LTIQNDSFKSMIVYKVIEIQQIDETGLCSVSVSQSHIQFDSKAAGFP